VLCNNHTNPSIDLGVDGSPSAIFKKRLTESPAIVRDQSEYRIEGSLSEPFLLNFRVFPYLWDRACYLKGFFHAIMKNRRGLPEFTQETTA
jgi:hypothetical protein